MLMIAALIPDNAALLCEGLAGTQETEDAEEVDDGAVEDAPPPPTQTEAAPPPQKRTQAFYNDILRRKGQEACERLRSLSPFHIFLRQVDRDLISQIGSRCSPLALAYGECGAALYELQQLSLTVECTLMNMTNSLLSIKEVCSFVFHIYICLFR